MTVLHAPLAVSGFLTATHGKNSVLADGKQYVWNMMNSENASGGVMNVWAGNGYVSNRMNIVLAL